MISRWSVPGRGPAPGRNVVMYVSDDPVFSEPVFRAFEADMGIRVKAEYHTEETKSTGVMNRFLAEKDSPPRTCTGPASRCGRAPWKR